MSTAPCAGTIPRWANECQTLGCFNLDMGVHERDFILLTEDIKDKNLTYMKEENIWPLTTWGKHLDEVILVEESVTTLAEKFKMG